MSQSTFIKDPDERVDFSIDWEKVLKDGEDISISSWIVPIGITDDGSGTVGVVTTIFLTGGTNMSDYTITNQIHTTQARIYNQSLIIKVRNK